MFLHSPGSQIYGLPISKALGHYKVINGVVEFKWIYMCAKWLMWCKDGRQRKLLELEGTCETKIFSAQCYAGKCYAGKCYAGKCDAGKVYACIFDLSYKTFCTAEFAWNNYSYLINTYVLGLPPIHFLYCWAFTSFVVDTVILEMKMCRKKFWTGVRITTRAQI